MDNKLVEFKLLEGKGFCEESNQKSVEELNEISEEKFQVEFEILSPTDIIDVKNPEKREFLLEAQELDNQISVIEAEIQKLNVDIDRLTNHADGWDYLIAVASGIITGLIDSFFVGKLDLAECRKYGSDRVEKIVKKFGGSDNLEKAIKNLEKKTKSAFPSDSNINDYGGARQHHLRDFAHHPTIVGLLCSLLTQFTGMCYGTDTAGRFLVAPVKDKSRIGDTIPKKVVYGTLYWFLHLVSDMAGSNATPGSGTGIPGPILALAKELSALPIFKKTKNVNGVEVKEFSQIISKIFNGTFFAEYGLDGKIIQETVVRIDLRTEIGILHKQALPVVINECIVRTFYAIRRFVMEVKEHPISSFKDLKLLNWKNIVPFGNRTIVRMITIATGTFTAVDLADAAIRGAISSGGNAALFAKEMILRVNFVGVGRFAIAVVTDVGMGIKREKLRDERMKLYSEMLYLSNAKIFYLEAGMWKEAEETQIVLEKTWDIAEKSIEAAGKQWSEIENKTENISKKISTLPEDFKQELLDIL